jgi:hypothetical protein
MALDFKKMGKITKNSDPNFDPVKIRRLMAILKPIFEPTEKLPLCANTI